MTASKPRQIRRHIRLRCQLLLSGPNDFVAYTANLSVTGAYIRVAATQEELPIEAGTSFFLRLLLSDNDRPVEVQCVARWLNVDDRDANGRPVVGVGLEFKHLTADVRARLERCVDEYRTAVLLLETENATSSEIERTLAEEFRLLRCLSVGDALSVLDVHDVAVIVVVESPATDAAAFLADVDATFARLDAARIIVGPGTNTRSLHDLINVGRVAHYHARSLDPQLLSLSVRRAAEAYVLGAENRRLNTELERSNARLKRENAYLRQKLEGQASFDTIVGRSPELRRCLAELERIRDRDVTVHIHGETGTGKELVARGLHLGGRRSDKPFVAQNCAGMTESLLQSTLFGHERGAFTGADRARPGLFKEADGGTLFLDEVADLPMSVQGALLRVLQEGEIVAVGASRSQKVNVRVISATHKDLRAEVQHGRFREDLYFRLVVLSVSIPALRDRAGDIAILAQHFLETCCERYGKNIRGLTPQAVLALERYSWPGNVRELENEIERLVVLAPNDGEVDADLISAHVRGERHRAATNTSDAVAMPRGIAYDTAMDQAQRLLVARALEATNGNVAKAAQALQIERTRMLKLARRLGVRPESYRR